MAEKKEKPTKNKLKKSRKEGIVNKSEEFILLLIVTISVEVILAVSGSGIEHLTQLFRLSVSLVNTPFDVSIRIVAGMVISKLCLFILPVAGLVILARLTGSWLQFGIIFSPSSAAFKFDRLNPANKIRQLFSTSQLTDLLMNFFKFCTIIYLTSQTLFPRLGDFIYLSQNTLTVYPSLLLTVLRELFHQILISLIILAVTDIALKRYFFLKKQGMSIEEIRRENKETEGDPLMKSYRKKRSTDAAQQTRTVPPTPDAEAILQQARVVISDSASRIVVLDDEQQEMSLPRVIFKQDGNAAIDLIKKARIKNIPVINAPRLTCILTTYETGQYISHEAIAEVAKIYRTLPQSRNHG